MIRKSAWAVFDPRGVAEAERLVVPRIPDLEGMRHRRARRYEVERQPPVAQNRGWAARLGAQVALPSSAMKP